MKSAILYYSNTGHTKKVVDKLAKAQGADIIEIQPVKKHGMLHTMLVGCPRAMLRKGVAIKPIQQDLTAYDMITLASPVWAGHPAPAFNEAVRLLPKHKNVQIVLVSAGGETDATADGTRHLIRKQGCNLIHYKDVKQSV